MFFIFFSFFSLLACIHLNTCASEEKITIEIIEKNHNLLTKKFNKYQTFLRENKYYLKKIEKQKKYQKLIEAVQESIKKKELLAGTLYYALDITSTILVELANNASLTSEHIKQFKITQSMYEQIP